MTETSSGERKHHDLSLVWCKAVIDKISNKLEAITKDQT